MELNHKQAENRLKDIADELARLDERAKDPEKGLTDQDETYWKDLVDEARAVEEHKKALEREADRARIDSMATTGGKIVVEKGSPDVDSRLPDNGKRFKNPYDLSEMRAGLNPAEQSAEFRARALSAIEKMPVTDDNARDAMTTFIERYDTRDGRLARLALATSDEGYVSAFGKLMSGSGNDSHLDESERQALSRAMSLSDTAGGYLVPFQLDPSVIITANGSFNQVRQIARTVVATGDVWHGVSSAGVTGSWDDEATEVSDDAPTLAQPTITVHKLAIFVPISIEALMDAQNVAQEVSEMIAFEKDRLESIAFVTGSGTSQPFGIVTALTGITSSVITTATADAFNLIDLYKLDEQLPARYRQRGSFLASRAIYNDVRQFDTAGGAALWERLGADVPGLLLGRPAAEAEAMAASPSGTNIHFMVFGDFNNYVIADRIGTTVEFVPHLFGASGRPTGQRGWYAYARVGADSVNDGAFRILNGA